jgi:DNA polymerase IV (archaeal DinB-like DNA polymerase)
MKSRIIVHIDMDCFFAQVEERESPQFKGKPVVVGADPNGGKGRGVVSTANYEARKYGIHSALPISKAYALCPEAIFLPPNFELYSRTSERIMQIIRNVIQLYSPDHRTILNMEQMSLDEAYIDITENLWYLFFTIVKNRYQREKWEKAQEIAEHMRAEILRQEKLACSCGIGPNKMIAKIACEKAKPNGVLTVRPAEAEKFVEPLDIEKMPGIGKKTAEILKGSGVRIVKDLKSRSEHDLQNLFGSRAKEMYRRSYGVDNNAVESIREVKSIGKEITFENDTRDPELLIRTFQDLAREVAKEAVEQDCSWKTVTVVCRFSGFETHTKAKSVQKPTKDWTAFRAEGMKLFLRFIMEKQKSIRLIGIRAKIADSSRL